MENIHGFLRIGRGNWVVPPLFLCYNQKSTKCAFYNCKQGRNHDRLSGKTEGGLFAFFW